MAALEGERHAAGGADATMAIASKPAFSLSVCLYCGVWMLSVLRWIWFAMCLLEEAGWGGCWLMSCELSIFLAPLS